MCAKGGAAAAGMHPVMNAVNGVYFCFTFFMKVQKQVLLLNNYCPCSLSVERKKILCMCEVNI